MLMLVNTNQVERFPGEGITVIEIEALEKLFEKRPADSTITVVCKCSGCGKDVLIDITHTSRGFGLNGGFSFEVAPDKYFIECRNCHRSKKETWILGV